MFPTGRDSGTFWDKGTELSSLSWNKGTTGKTQDGTQDGMRDGTWDGMVQYFDSCPVLWDKTGQSRKGHSK